MKKALTPSKVVFTAQMDQRLTAFTEHGFSKAQAQAAAPASALAAAGVPTSAVAASPAPPQKAEAAASGGALAARLRAAKKR